jgi:hypothetical protein
MKTPGGDEFVINVCKAIAHETWALKVDNPSEVAGFVRRSHGDISIGYAFHLFLREFPEFVIQKSQYDTGL